MAEKKFYWLKLDEDFFDSHEAKVIEGTFRGPETLLFYIKLLVESVGHNGMLRFSARVPYDKAKLASLTKMSPEAVQEATEVLTDLGLMETLDDGTIYLPAVEEMTGSRSQSEEAVRQRRHRERQRAQEEPDAKEVTEERDGSVTDVTAERDRSVTNRNERLDIRDKSIDKKESKEKKRAKFSPPSYEEARDYYASKTYAFGFDKWWTYYTEAERPWTKGDGTPVKDWKRTMATWQNREAEKPAGEKSNRTNHKGREYSDEFLEGLYKKLE